MVPPNRQKCPLAVLTSPASVMFTIYVNPEKAPAALQSKANGTPLSALRLKRGATIPICVVLLGVNDACNLRIGVKNKGGYEEDLLLYAAASSGTTTDEGLAFVLNLLVNSTQLDDALQVGSGLENAPATLAAITEISWTENDSQRITDTLSTTIVNDIIRLSASPPSSAEAEYPAPSQIATKAWVQNLKASAAEYGLVLLEADAIIENDDYSAIALTPGGALAIPAASFDSRGTVRLGTNTPILGSGVLLVGETPNGRLAVNASGLTAYALAVEEGFEGSLQEWLASLKGEIGELTEDQQNALNNAATHLSNTQIHVSEQERQSWNTKLSPDSLCQEKTVILGGSDNRGAVTYITLAAHLIPMGKLLTLSISVPDAVFPNAVDSVNELHAVLAIETGTRTYQWLATSTDAHLISRGAFLTWHFERAPISPSAVLRINFIRADSVAHDPTDAGGNSAVYAKLMVARDASLGESFSTGVWRTWLPEITLSYEADKFAEAAALDLHSINNVAHLSTDEHSALSAIIQAHSSEKAWRMAFFCDASSLPLTLLAATGKSFVDLLSAASLAEGQFMIPIGEHMVLICRGSAEWRSCALWDSLAAYADERKILHFIEI